jgi:hypothetical protein
MPALAILNTSILTSDGQYVMETITLDQAKQLVKDADSIDSAVGHVSTAEILTTLLDINIDVNRQMFEQQVNQTALVFKLNGRPPEGVVLSRDEIEAIGYSFKTLVRF